MMNRIRDKVRDGEPLTLDDGVQLFQHRNLLELGLLANEVRERLHGDRTYFNRNLHINATNVCEASCRFCSFARLEEGKPGAYTMSHAEAWGKLQARLDAQDPITEIHIVNGLHPGLAFDFHKKYGLPIAEVLTRLRTAGLDSIPGGGAEIFAARVRKKICDDKCSGD